MTSHRFARRRPLHHALLAGGIALAVPVAAAEPAGDTANPELADIVVTATRSGAESVQNVPIAISVVNIDQVTKSNQGNLVDLAKFTPSLAITEGAPGFNKFNMRGLATGGYRTSDTSDRSLVAVYLDDTPISVQGQTPDLKVYDLERVEILRGPQGTLFGAGSMAGTIRFVTAKPDTKKFFGSAEADGAYTEHGDGSYNFRGMVNLPVVRDTLALRGNFYIGRDGGWIDDIGAYNRKDVNSNRTTQARIAARWTPTPDLTIDAAFTYEQSRAHGLNTGLSGLPGYTVSTNSPEGTSDKFRLYQLGGQYNLGFADFIATAAYTDRNIGFNASPEPQIGYFFQDYGSGLPVGPGHYPLFTQPASTTRRSPTRSPPRCTRSTTRSRTSWRRHASPRTTTSSSSGPPACSTRRSSGTCSRTSRRRASTLSPTRTTSTARSTRRTACTTRRRSTPRSTPTTSSPACRTRTSTRSRSMPTARGTRRRAST